MSTPGPCWIAGLVLADDGQHVLLVERDEHQWDLPSGPLHRREPIAQAVRRVVAAQATLGVRVGHLIGAHEVPDGLHGKTTLVFTTQHVLGRPAATGSTRSCRWVTLPQAAHMLGPARAIQLTGAGPTMTVRPTG